LTDDAAVAYRQTLSSWRSQCTKALNYTGSVYGIPGLEWTKTSYIQPQIHPYDLFMFDPVSQSYTIEKYLTDLRDRYGGVDAILLWPTFPQLGMDDRNQFDMFRCLKGGVPGLKALVAELHQHGVKVLLAYK
jgi:hypothetical protein